MGLGILAGSPNTYLSSDWYATGDKLAIWIEREIPCFVGKVPVEYTQALLDVLQRRVRDNIIRDAFLTLAKKGIEFDFPLNWSARFLMGVVVPPPPPTTSRLPPPPQMRAVSRGEAEQIKRHTIEEYERRYVLAIKTNNDAGAEQIIVAVLGSKLINSSALTIRS